MGALFDIVQILNACCPKFSVYYDLQHRVDRCVVIDNFRLRLLFWHSRLQIVKVHHHRSVFTPCGGSPNPGTARFRFFTGGAELGGRFFPVPFRRLPFGVSITLRIQ